MSTIPTVGGQRFKGLKKTPKIVKFLGLELEITKLSVTDVLAVQEYTKELAGDPLKEIPADEHANIKGLINIIKIGSAELAEYADEDLREIAIDDLNKLADEILKFSGMGSNLKTS